MSSYEKEKAFALETVRQAAKLVRKIREEMIGPAFTKDDKSPVTVADFTVQALIGKRLKEFFPQDLLVGEEDSAELCTMSGKPVLEKICTYLKTAGISANAETVCGWIDHGKSTTGKRFWTLDPIDGTKGFIRGDHYAVALALIENGEIKLGVLGCPNLKEAGLTDNLGAGTLAFAVRGQGAWWTSLEEDSGAKPLKVSEHKQPFETIMLRSFETQHVDSPRMSELKRILGIKNAPILMDSLTKYVVLAAGHADLMLRFPVEDHPYECIWDQAPGVIIIEEAGGKVTDLDGKPLDYTKGRQLLSNRGVLLSNGHLHQAVKEAIQQIQHKH